MTTWLLFFFAGAGAPLSPGLGLRVGDGITPGQAKRGA